jgi:crossover junction endodeoxyribonuclease RuvC
MVIIGIDPGFSGAWGAIKHDSSFVACGDMTHNAHHIESVSVLRDIMQACGQDDRIAVLEYVSSRPGQGVSSVFKFGMAYGAAISICERLGDWRTVTPKVWKQAMRLSKDKAESLALARALWPQAPLTRVKDNGRAEALLIAEWLRRSLEL